jgi:hypothetical protein
VSTMDRAPNARQGNSGMNTPTETEREELLEWAAIYIRKCEGVYVFDFETSFEAWELRALADEIDRRTNNEL